MSSNTSGGRCVFRKGHILYVFIIILAVYFITTRVPFGGYDFTPDKGGMIKGTAGDIPLDPESPWPKFRANALQNGRGHSLPRFNPAARPWTYRTGKGIFSSPVVDRDGTVYIGSADRRFYAIRRDGTLKWSLETGEIIDSSALLDDRGRVYVGSGDAHVYCLDRATGRVLWKTAAHSAEEVLKEFRIKTYNLNWFEGNIGMLKDGTIIAPNDNYLVYAIERDSGRRIMQYPGNEMIWSLPAYNPSTGRIFFGTCFMAVKNVYCYEAAGGKPLWTAGGLGSNAATILLTSAKKNGALVVGGFDGYLRAYAQDSGKQLWKLGVRDHIYSSPAQLSDGTIIQPSADGTVYAVNPADGRVKWAFDTLEPIRSSPAVDGADRIYTGSGEGRLFCINPDGTLRWAYRCIEEDRNDLNSSPALGKDGVYIAGENGGVFFVPYDYPLGPAGERDRLCARGPGEELPDDGVFLVYTTRFGRLLSEAPKTLDANEPVTFSLCVREKGDTVLSALDRDSIETTVTGSPKMQTHVAANRRFVTLFPLETWTGPGGGTITMRIKGTYTKDLSRFGLKFFGGSKGGEFDQTLTFAVPGRKAGAMPYCVPRNPGDPSASFVFSRLAAPNPTMLPSWNQIGFDSLHYCAGAVEGSGSRIILWVIGGKPGPGGSDAVVNPKLEVRYPLVLDYDGGLLTFHNYDGFKINFIGSWDMPFGVYRLATAADPVTGRILKPASFNAVALCDEIEFYGRFLKIMGMSEFDTGRMAVYGGADLALRGKGFDVPPAGLGSVKISADDSSARAVISGSRLKKSDHVFSLVLIDEAAGTVFPLYYTKRTAVESAPDGTVTGVAVSFGKGEVKGKVRAYLMVDTCPAYRASLSM